MTLPKPDLAIMKTSMPTLTSKLIGEFGNQPNVYFDGKVVSWPLVGSQQANPTLKKDSTIGTIQPGEYEFPAGHREEVTVLSGDLRAAVEGGEFKNFGPLETVVANANTTLRLKVEDAPVEYLCEYH